MTSHEPPTSEGAKGRSNGIDWGAALHRHDHLLRVAVFARLREPHAVEEVMQEVALAAVAQRAPVNDQAKLAPWLHRLAVRQALLYRRKRGRQRRLAGRYAELRLAQDQTDGKDALCWLLLDERSRLIREALGRLPARDSEILILKYTEDWSYRELAERLAISEAAVEARLHRARGRLREAMAAYGAIEVRV